jgi:hypothetical protein
VPAGIGARTAATEIDGNQSSELQEAAPHCLVRNINAALGRKILNVSV